jgi:hypothetical protein
MATAPLMITLGFAGEALMRFAKPTMKPFGLFDPADLPNTGLPAVFSLATFRSRGRVCHFYLLRKLQSSMLSNR